MNITITKLLDYYIGIPLCFIFGVLYKPIDMIFQRGSDIKPKKILLIKTWGLGNIVIMLPVLKYLRKNFPDAEISFLSLKNNKGILEENPFLDYYYLLDLNGMFNFLNNSVKLVYQLRKKRFDLVLDFDQFARFSALICLFAGIPFRVGFDTPTQGKKWAFNLPVPYKNDQHTVCAFADLLKKIGIKEIDLAPVAVNITARDKSKVNEFLERNELNAAKVLVGMHLGSGDNFPQRRWPTEYFIELAIMMIKHFDATIILTGNTEDEFQLNKYFCAKVDKGVYNVCRKFNVRETAYLIQNCRLFFSADTAPLHIATAMGVDVVCFFGPNTPVLYGPRGKNDAVFYRNINCSPCLTNFNAKTSNCRKPVCITEITVNDAWEKIMKYFEKPKYVKLADYAQDI